MPRTEIALAKVQSKLETAPLLTQTVIALATVQSMLETAQLLAQTVIAPLWGQSTVYTTTLVGMKVSLSLFECTDYQLILAGVKEIRRHSRKNLPDHHFLSLTSRLALVAKRAHSELGRKGNALSILELFLALAIRKTSNLMHCHGAGGGSVIVNRNYNLVLSVV
jgi:hypothetical protein